MGEGNLFSQKIDVLDMLISVFTEHEKEISNLVHDLSERERTLDGLIGRLERALGWVEDD